MFDLQGCISQVHHGRSGGASGSWESLSCEVFEVCFLEEISVPGPTLCSGEVS